jgi:phosphoglycolate phosphatase
MAGEQDAGHHLHAGRHLNNEANVMTTIRAIVFDVDGVLLDSLEPHLRICEDKNREYGLALKIPNSAGLREMVRKGVKINPMERFFLAVGFPPEFAEKAFAQYKEIFRQKYSPRPFPNVYETLERLHQSGYTLGIVTSNVIANIVEALGPSIDFFEPTCIYTKDNMADLSKSAALKAAMVTLKVSGAKTTYVGDQSSDWEAAKEAGVGFLGVAYGWGISREEKRFAVAQDVVGIYNYFSREALESP